MKNTKTIGYSSAIISVTLMGTLGVFIREISSNEYIIIFSRFSFGLLFLIFYLFLKKDIGNIKTAKFSPYLAMTGVLMVITTLCYINAVNSTSLANAVFLLYLAPLIAVGIATVLLKEKFTLLNAGLLCLALLGILFLLEFNISFNIDESKGYLWGIGSAIGYALYIVLNRKIPETIPPLTRAFYQFLFGVIVILPFLDTSLFNVSTKDIYLLIAVGFFHGFLALSLAITAIKNLKTIEYGTISYVEPLVATLIGFAFYAESLTLLQFIGCAIVFCGGMVQVVATKNG
ncbi:DMT family transporter [Anaerolineales bacterium HSG6]|nr:DMT family transporter [Anaerolineales bacterium HSG6]